MGRGPVCVSASVLWPSGPCQSERLAEPAPLPWLNHAQRDYVLLTTLTISASASQTAQTALLRMTRAYLGRIEALGVQPTIIGVDAGGGNASCRPLLDAGFACLPDRWHAYCAVRNHSVMSWVKGPSGRDTDRFGTRTVAVDAKYWYARRFLRLGHAVVFADVDVVFFKPPTARAEGLLQGLSDSHTAEDSDDERRIGNATRCDAFLHYGAPCQSTGLWFAQPCGPVVAFFDHLLQRMRTSCEWEQSLFNRALHDPIHQTTWMGLLNYSVWSKRHYANVAVIEDRIAVGLPIDPVAMHMGYVRAADKVARLEGGAASFPTIPKLNSQLHTRTHAIRALRRRPSTARAAAAPSWRASRRE